MNLLGQWREIQSPYYQGQSLPVGGLAYYVSPPSNFADIVADPFHAFFYVVFILTACALFSKTWIEVSGASARDVAKQLRDQQVCSNYISPLAYITIDDNAWTQRVVNC